MRIGTLLSTFGGIIHQAGSQSHTSSGTGIYITLAQSTPSFEQYNAKQLESGGEERKRESEMHALKQKGGGDFASASRGLCPRGGSG